MESKSLIWIGVFIGSSIGGFLPTLWGGDVMSLSSIILTAVGGFLGIWVGYKLSQ